MGILSNHKVLITGGSDGIGLAMAKAMSSVGAELILIGRDEAKLSRAARTLGEQGSQVSVMAWDLSKVNTLRRLGELILEQHPDLRVLVNNAAEARFVPFVQTGSTDLDYQIDLNLKAPFLLSQALLPALKNNQGNIINISSFHAERNWPGIPDTAFALSKGGLNALTRAMAYELGPQGVRVNAIAPGNVLSPKVEAFLDGLPEELKADTQDLIQLSYPLGGMGQPGDVAGLAVFLASSQASWITGGVFKVDGGLCTN